MMTHTQLKTLITEAVLLFILSVALVIGGYFISSENANKRLQNLYHSRFIRRSRASISVTMQTAHLTDMFLTLLLSRFTDRI